MPLVTRYNLIEQWDSGVPKFLQLYFVSVITCKERLPWYILKLPKSMENLDNVGTIVPIPFSRNVVLESSEVGIVIPTSFLKNVGSVNVIYV